ncbi:MAG TPA: hypothetical protein VIR57_12100 [Chloroflexota bacterium]|jgi:hypothetical protein
MANLTLRVWSEFLTPRELSQPPVVELLARFHCGVLVQLSQNRLDDQMAGALCVLANAGVPDIGLWLLLDPAAGYWPSERNAQAVLELTRRVVEWHPPAGWLAIDLEPPLWQARRSRLRSAHENLNPARFASASNTFRQVIDLAHGAGLQVLCAAHDYLAEDVWLRRPVLQDLHEAPVLGLPWDLVSVMLYGSMMDAAPADGRRWMFDTARLLPSIPLGASIGLTGVGILGNEPHYASPLELAQDAAALKAAGVTDFAICSLEGMLASPNPEDWLRAVAEAEPARPPASAWARRERVRRRVLAVMAAGCRALRA